VHLRQLRYVLEVHRSGNHISAAAEALHTSQPGVSKQIQMLEQELGFDIFERTRNRVVGLTEPGREVLDTIQRVFAEIDSLKKIRDDYSRCQEGSLTIATTHTQARYILPSMIDRFIHLCPKVRLSLRQDNPTNCCAAVQAGEADVAIGTETLHPFPGLTMLPWRSITRSLIAAKGHPILSVPELTLAEIAKYPIIAHDPYRSGRWKIMEAFMRCGIQPNILFNAVDADVSKTYVELGLGISILASAAFDSAHDVGIEARDASHLFEASTTFVSLRANAYLRRFVFDFLETLDPPVSRADVRRAVQNA
jgi:LysR family transcriptional regulator, cys regulon transcriptional activator